MNNSYDKKLFLIGMLFPLLTACITITTSMDVYIDSTDETVFANIKQDVRKFATQHGYDCDYSFYTGYKDGRLVCIGSGSANLKSMEVSGALSATRSKENIEVSLTDQDVVLMPPYRGLTQFQKRFQPTYLSFFSKYKALYNIEGLIYNSNDGTTETIAIP